MKSNERHETRKASVPTSGNSSTGKPKEPVYRLLGESGLVEDEEGNIYRASEINGKSEPEKSKESSKRDLAKEFDFFPELEDKTNPDYWHYYYDPRYCGPDPEAYMNRMARIYRNKARKEKILAFFKLKKVSTSKKKRKERKKDKGFELRPTYKNLNSGMIFTGVVDSNNNVIVSDKDYRWVGRFLNGLAMAQKRESKKWGFIDRHGKEVVPCVWRSVGMFSEGRAAVQDDKHKCGYVSMNGRLAIPCEWDEAWPFHEGLAKVQKEKKLGMINQWGDIIIPYIWKGMGECSEGLINVKDNDGKCGFIDNTGKVVIPCRWREAWIFKDGLAVVQDSNKRLGFIDKSGKLVIPCRWKKVNYFVNGLAKVSDSKKFLLFDKWVYIDRQGSIVK